jgi:pilus assembly protein CpaC
MATRTVRTAALATLIVGAALAPMRPMTPARAADAGAGVPVIRVVASEATSRFIPLGIGKSVAIDLPADIKDVLVADPKIANAVIRSSRRVYLIGAKVGQTSIFFFDASGRQLAGFDIAVTRDLNGLRAALQRTLPNTTVNIEGVGDGVMLTGGVSSPVEAQQAFDIATRLVGDSAKVVNAITVNERDQVMLRVTVAEVSRDVVKQLGVNLSGSLSYGTAVVDFNTDNPFSASGQALTNSFLTATLPKVTATLRAMEQAGVIRTLAEPNLTAVSGETASFLAGGEFPVVTGTSGPPNFTPTVEYKKFGVSLVFTPVVMAQGRISLKVMTETSELSTEGNLTIGGFSIPSLKTRRAETTVEIPSGGSLAMAGMIKEQTKQSINGIPALMQIPVLGTLFKSRDYINNKTELVVLVTPYVTRAVAQKKLSRPDDGFADPSDPTSVLLGRLNRIYGLKGTATDPAQNYTGKYGFILD